MWPICCSPFPLGVPHESYRILVSIPCHLKPDVRFSRIRRSDHLRPAAFKDAPHIAQADRSTRSHSVEARHWDDGRRPASYAPAPMLSGASARIAPGPATSSWSYPCKFRDHATSPAASRPCSNRRSCGCRSGRLGRARQGSGLGQGRATGCLRQCLGQSRRTPHGPGWVP